MLRCRVTADDAFFKSCNSFLNEPVRRAGLKGPKSRSSPMPSPGHQRRHLCSWVLFTGPKGPTMKHNLHQTWHHAIRQALFSWQPPSPDSSVRLWSLPSERPLHCSDSRGAFYSTNVRTDATAQPWKPSPVHEALYSLLLS